MKKILLTLDALFDTRLGVIHKLCPQAARELVTSETYHLRDYDQWERLTHGQVSQDAFSNAWRDRGTDVLEQSMSTDIPLVIAQILHDYQKNMIDGLVKEHVGIDLDIYPYDLSDDETQVLIEVMQEITYQGLPVNIVSYGIDRTTPTLINEHYHCYITYEHGRWLRQHGLTLKNQPCRGVTLIGPRLYEKDPTELSGDEKKQSVFELKLLFLSFICIELIDASYFSVMDQSLRE